MKYEVNSHLLSLAKNISNFHFHFEKCFFACNTTMIQAITYFWNKEEQKGVPIEVIHDVQCLLSTHYNAWIVDNL